MEPSALDSSWMIEILKRPNVSLAEATAGLLRKSQEARADRLPLGILGLFCNDQFNL